jgi:hypothetical protein
MDVIELLSNPRAPTGCTTFKPGWPLPTGINLWVQGRAIEQYRRLTGRRRMTRPQVVMLIKQITINNGHIIFQYGDGSFLYNTGAGVAFLAKGSQILDCLKEGSPTPLPHESDGVSMQPDYLR